MKFKKKLAVFLMLNAVLFFAFILTFVLDSDNRRNPSFAWLDSSLLVMVDRIEIEGSRGNSVLVRRNDVWYFSTGRELFPVRQGRVEDLLTALTLRDVYTLRAVSAEARERLGLTEGAASRILVRGGVGLPLLDLRIGTGGVFGGEVYFQIAGRNEIFSGEDRFTLFTESRPQSWFELRLFPPETARHEIFGAARMMPAGTGVSAIQQVEVYFSGNRERTYTLRRSGGGWVFPGNENAVLDTPRVEAWLRSLMDAEGEDFAFSAPDDIEGNVIIWFGDGTIRTIQAGRLEENHHAGLSRRVMASDSSFVYVFSEWAFNRLFPESAFFLK